MTGSFLAMLDDEQLSRLSQTEREILMSLSEKAHGRQDQAHQAASDFVKRRIAELKAENEREADYQQQMEATFC